MVLEVSADGWAALEETPVVWDVLTTTCASGDRSDSGRIAAGTEGNEHGSFSDVVLPLVPAAATCRQARRQDKVEHNSTVRFGFHKKAGILQVTLMSRIGRWMGIL